MRNWNPWSPEDEFILRQLYPNTPNAEIAELLARDLRSIKNKAVKLDLHKDAEYLARLPSRIQPGHALYGIARPGLGHHPNCKRTQFKSGQRRGAAQHNWVPIGSEKVRDGYLVRKMTDDPSIYPAARWQFVHRLVWEAEHGPVPAGYAVAFKSGRFTVQRDAITLDALELVSRSDLMRRNTIHRLPPELREVIQLTGALKRKIRNRSERNAERRA